VRQTDLQPQASSLRKGYVDSTFGQLHYRQCGRGTALVLLHQTSQSSIQFALAMPLLAAAGYQVTAFDTPGYGMSDGPDEPPSITDYAGAIAQGMRQLDISTAIILGHHTGAAVAVALAANHPDHVVTLVLHSPPIYTESERLERLARPRLDQSPKEDGSHLLARWRMSYGKTGNGASLEATHMSTICAMIAGENEWYGHRAAFAFDLGEALSRTMAPLIVISNTGDIIHHLAKRGLDGKSGARYYEMEGGTSQIIYDEPGRWSDTVLAALKPQG